MEDHPNFQSDDSDVSVQRVLAKAGQPVAAQSLDPTRMTENAERAAAFLRALSHEGRLMILCHLASGERSVTELEHLLSMRQAAVSQQLSRLRLEGLVSARRDGKTIYYSILDPKVMNTVVLMHDLFCPEI